MDLNKLCLVFRFGVRQKVVLVLITVLLTALSVSGWLALKEEEKEILNEINRHGEDIVRFGSKSLAYSVVGYDYHTIQLLLDEIVQSNEISYAKVISGKGNTMAEAGNMHQLLKEDKKLALFERNILVENQKVGELILALDTSSTIARLEERKYSLVKREVIIILLIAIGEFLALSFLIIRPVSIMSRSLNDGVTEDGKIVEDIPIKSTDEFGLLAKQFNRLRQQLNASNEALQSKIDHADKQLIENNKQLLVQSNELKRMNDELKQVAVTDSLTGVYNRRHFEDILETEISHAKRYDETFSLILLDIDFFKNINDTYGHLEGDEVLKNVANILSDNMRKSDILCRIGGEEFIILCRHLDSDNANILAEKLRKSINSTAFKFSNHIINITVSIGISTFSSSANHSHKILIKQADDALYFCKQNGRNRVQHHDSMDKQKSESEEGNKSAVVHKLNQKDKG